jgi:hypothetical protein
MNDVWREEGIFREAAEEVRMLVSCRAGVLAGTEIWEVGLRQGISGMNAQQIEDNQSGSMQWA